VCAFIVMILSAEPAWCDPPDAARRGAARVMLITGVALAVIGAASLAIGVTFSFHQQNIDPGFQSLFVGLPLAVGTVESLFASFFILAGIVNSYPTGSARHARLIPTVSIDGTSARASIGVRF
jgi:hypothetical protein